MDDVIQRPSPNDYNDPVVGRVKLAGANVASVSVREAGSDSTDKFIFDSLGRVTEHQRLVNIGNGPEVELRQVYHYSEIGLTGVEEFEGNAPSPWRTQLFELNPAGLPVRLQVIVDAQTALRAAAVFVAPDRVTIDMSGRSGQRQVLESHSIQFDEEMLLKEHLVHSDTGTRVRRQYVMDDDHGWTLKYDNKHNSDKFICKLRVLDGGSLVSVYSNEMDLIRTELRQVGVGGSMVIDQAWRKGMSSLGGDRVLKVVDTAGMPILKTVFSGTVLVSASRFSAKWDALGNLSEVQEAELSSVGESGPKVMGCSRFVVEYRK